MKKNFIILIVALFIFARGCTCDSDSDSPKPGKFKLANSWGVGFDYENVPDGFLWITYDAMIANEVYAIFFEDKSSYNPRYIVTFEISHARRADCEITAYLASSQGGTRIMSKRFEDYMGRGGNWSFPSNIMVMDITEFAGKINSYDLFLEVYDSSVNSDEGTVVSFSIEYYSTYDKTGSSPDKTIISSDTNVATTNGNSVYLDILTIGEFSSPPAASRSPSKASISSLVNARSIDEIDLIVLKEIVGVNDGTKNYNRIINGHGTGLIPPTESQWAKIKKSALVVDSLAPPKAGASIPGSVDLSQTKYFPPIGNQGTEGSCVSFSVAYYIKTFYEAREHNRDLSTTGWNGSPWPGKPDSNLNWIFSPDFIYHQINDGVDEGSYFHDNVHVVTRIGCSTWSTFATSISNGVIWPDEDAWREAPLYRGDIPDEDTWSSYYILTVDSYDKIKILKTLLANNIMVTIAVDADRYEDLSADDVWDTDNYADVPVYDTNHANTVVGYRDD